MTDNMTDDIAIASARAHRYAGQPAGVKAALEACIAYFDWHPVVAGVSLTAVAATGLLVAQRVFDATVPLVGGWALYTPLNGIVLAFLLMSRRRLWLWIVLGYIMALSLGGRSSDVSHAHGPLEIAGNLLEVLIAAFCLPPFRNLKQWLLEPRLLAAFAGYAMLLGPAAMALTVAHRFPGSLDSFGVLHSGYLERVRIVFFAESVGMALWTPLALVLVNRETYSLLRGRALLITVGMLALVAMATWLAFTQSSYPVIFLPYIVLVVMAFRQGLRGAVLGTAVAAAVVNAFTVHGHNFLPGAPNFWTAPASGEQALLVQGYLTLAALMVFPVSVTLLKRKELEDRLLGYEIELDRLKSIDRLTGVSNRKRFDLVLNREWQRATRDPKPLALLMIDVDYFDLYNECYGHQAGDECLRLIATRIADQPHRAYDLVSRYDGGKFTVLLPGAPGVAVQRIAEEFRSHVAALDWPHARSLFERVTVSVGWVSMMPESDLQPAVLIAAAEQALTLAKNKGRNRVEGFSGDAVALTPTAQ